MAFDVAGDTNRPRLKGCEFRAVICPSVCSCGNRTSSGKLGEAEHGHRGRVVYDSSRAPSSLCWELYHNRFVQQPHNRFAPEVLHPEVSHELDPWTLERL